MKPTLSKTHLFTRSTLLLLIIWYCLATLPYLSDYPIIETAQIGIAAPAYKLASQGVYGNDLYRGFYHTDRYNYEYLPLYPLTVALFYKLFGLGMWQGRLVSVFCGLMTLLLTFQLGKQLHNTFTGLLAAVALSFFSITVLNAGDMYPGAIPLFDLARVLRYDMMVPPFLLLACIIFMKEYNKQAEGARSRGYFLAGLFVGLATLSHIYGAFILPALGLLLFWRDRWGMWRKSAVYLLGLGWFIVLLPWIWYVLQDFPDYLGQQLRHESRFDLFNPAFYLDSLLREPWRYVRVTGSFRHPVLIPRPGLWLAGTAVLATNITLWRYIWRPTSTHSRLRLENGRFLLLTLPVLALLLALLISFKRYTYIALLLPFLALEIGFGLAMLWQATSLFPWWRVGLATWLGVTLLEGSYRVAQNLQMARETIPYLEVTAEARNTIPAGSKILILHGYWLGLVHADVYSLDLAFALSDTAYGYTNPPTMPEVIEQIAPQYIVLEHNLLKQYERDPAGVPSEKLIRQWRTLDLYLQNRCQIVSFPPYAPGYGIIAVYKC